MMKWILSAVGIAVLSVPAYMAYLLSSYNTRGVSTTYTYLPSLSPNGGRVAVAKHVTGQGWQFFESTDMATWHPVPVAPGQQPRSTIGYSPDGKQLIFVTNPVRPDGLRKTEEQTEVVDASSTVWRLPLGAERNALPEKVFSHDGALTNVLPLKNGGYAFMAKVSETLNTSWSPNPRASRSWSNYRWHLRTPEGDVKLLSNENYAFFSSASLIRDVATIMMIPTAPDQEQLKGRNHLVITSIVPHHADVKLEALVDKNNKTGGPHLACDWLGETCARAVAYTNAQGYYSHALDIVRNEKSCPVTGLPNRLEKIEISRDGTHIALITRPTPFQETGYQLAVVSINADGCAGLIRFFELP